MPLVGLAHENLQALSACPLARSKGRSTRMKRLGPQSVWTATSSTFYCGKNEKEIFAVWTLGLQD